MTWRRMARARMTLSLVAASRVAVDELPRNWALKSIMLDRGCHRSTGGLDGRWEGTAGGVTDRIHRGRWNRRSGVVRGQQHRGPGDGGRLRGRLRRNKSCPVEVRLSHARQRQGAFDVAGCRRTRITERSPSVPEDGEVGSGFLGGCASGDAVFYARASGGRPSCD